MLSSWVDFMIAETKLLAYDYSMTQERLESGITKSIAKVQNFVSNDSEPTASSIETHRNGIINSFANATTDTTRWNIIFEQYWIALYGNGIYAYNAYRRTGYPTTLQPNIEPDPGGFVRSLPYPAVFVETNRSVSQKESVGVKVFWDTNSDSPTFPSAN